jgi:hypothetical protein
VSLPQGLSPAPIDLSPVKVTEPFDARTSRPAGAHRQKSIVIRGEGWKPAREDPKMMIGALLLMPLTDQIIEISPKGPLTLAQAVQKAEGQPGTVIRLKTGIYSLSQPLQLTSQHSGVTIEAAPGQKPLLTGGVEVKDWKQEGHLWMAPAPAGLADKGSRLFMVNGEIRPRSRWPEEGRLTHETVFDVRWMSTTGGGWERKPTPEELGGFRFKEGDLGPWLDPKSAEVTVFHMWDDSCLGISSIDFESRTLAFSSPAGHPPGAFGVQQYVVWNTAKGLTKPGTWFLDRTSSQVVYRPKPGERPETAVTLLGSLETLISIEGAENVSIKGLALQGCSAPLKSGGFAAGDYPGVVTASQCPGLNLESLSISSSAGYGMRAWSCPEGAVTRCSVKDMGAGGIRLEGDRSKITDCRVERIGLQYPSGVGIWTSGASARVSHNLVTDTSYTAILGAGAGSVIEANRIERPMLALSDGAAIYVGFNENITIRGNIVSGVVQNHGYGSSAYYLDEQSKNCLVEGNVSVGASFPSQNHMAKGGVIRGNLFISEEDLTLAFARCTGFRLEANVLISKTGIKLRAPVDGFAGLEGNHWDPGTGTVTLTILDQYAEKGSALLPGVSSAKPQFSRPRPDVYVIKLPNQSQPKTWDMREAGPRS